MGQLFNRKLVEVFGEISSVLSSDLESQFDEISTMFANSSNCCIFGLGAGRMGYSLQAFIMRLSHMGHQAYMLGDTTLPRVSAGDIVIVNSSSGETKTIVLLAKLAKAHGAKLVVVTTKATSALGKMADIVVKIETTKSKQPMKTVYEQATYILFDILVSNLIDALEIDLEFMSSNHSILE